MNMTNKENSLKFIVNSPHWPAYVEYINDQIQRMRKEYDNCDTERLKWLQGAIHAMTEMTRKAERDFKDR